MGLSFRETTHRPLSSSCLGLPYRILSINHKKELLRGLLVSGRLTFLKIRIEAGAVLLPALNEYKTNPKNPKP